MRSVLVYRGLPSPKHASRRIGPQSGPSKLTGSETRVERRLPRSALSLGTLQRGDDYPVGLAGYSHTLSQRRFTGSRRISADAGLFGHGDEVISPRTRNKSPNLPTVEPSY